MGDVVMVTGTDTGVGKTVAMAWLAWRAARVLSVAVIKAAQTGADPAVDGDEAFFRAALAGLDVTVETVLDLPEPLAPSIAARRAGRRVDFEGLARRCLEVAATRDLALVEGSGGLLVPLDETHDFADLAGRLGARLVVVVRPGLGTLNHTALTLEAAARRGLGVDALVCSGVSAQQDVVESENLRFFRERYPGIPLIVLPRAPQADLARPQRLAGRIEGRPPAWLPGGLQIEGGAGERL